MEKYVEVYRDPDVTGHFSLPSTDIDNVQVKLTPTSSVIWWREPPVSTAAGGSIGEFCCTTIR